MPRLYLHQLGGPADDADGGRARAGFFLHRLKRRAANGTAYGAVLPGALGRIGSPSSASCRTNSSSSGSRV